MTRNRSAFVIIAISVALATAVTVLLWPGLLVLEIPPLTPVAETKAAPAVEPQPVPDPAKQQAAPPDLPSPQHRPNMAKPSPSVLPAPEPQPTPSIETASPPRPPLPQQGKSGVRPVRSSPEAASIADAIRRQLTAGTILYQPSVEMAVGVPSTVLLRVSSDPSADIRKGLQSSGYVVEAASVSYRMKAVLEPPPQFATAVPLGGLADGVQLVGPAGFASWTWSVTPLKSHDFDMTLYVYALINIDGEQSPHMLTTKTAKISVRSSPLSAQILKQTELLAGKIYDKLPETVASAIVGGMTATACLIWRKRKATGKRPRRRPPTPRIARA